MTAGTAGLRGKRRRVPRVPVKPVPIATALALSIGSLVALAVVAVLAISLAANARNTMQLLTESAELVLELEEAVIRSHLDPAAEQLAFLAALIGRGAIDPADDQVMFALLSGAIAATPQTDNLVLFDTQILMNGVARDGNRAVPLSGPPSNPWRVTQAFTEVGDGTDGFWGPVVYIAPTDRSVVTRIHPVRVDDQLIGLLVATVPLQALSHLLRELAEESEGGTPFVLLGRDQVLAHPGLLEGHPGLSDQRPLPSLYETGDPILPAMWTRGRRGFVQGEEVTALTVSLGNQDYLAIFREVSDYGEIPMVLGIHYPLDEVDEQLARLAISGFAGVLVLVVSIIAAIVLGKWLARPIKAVAEQSLVIANHADPSAIDPVPGSAFRELNDQARAFNAMVQGLRWLHTYVPQRLVQRLVKKGLDERVGSIDRKLTVMFTDIAGYTSMVETLSAQETAAFLNHHFALIGACVEAEGGTIDKFIGDSLMAFWNAPDRQENHPESACRAALAIAVAIQSDNQARLEAGLPPVRLRIGIHTGRMVAGNIGAPGRMNYTIVGDAVNTGSRLEELGKDLCPDAPDAAILVSDETRARLGDGFTVEDCGRHSVRGRQGLIRVYRLQ